MENIAKMMIKVSSRTRTQECEPICQNLNFHLFHPQIKFLALWCARMCYYENSNHDSWLVWSFLNPSRRDRTSLDIIITKLLHVISLTLANMPIPWFFTVWSSHKFLIIFSNFIFWHSFNKNIIFQEMKWEMRLLALLNL